MIFSKTTGPFFFIFWGFKFNIPCLLKLNQSYLNSSHTMHPKTSTTSSCLSRTDTGNAYKKYILLKNDFLKNFWAVFLHNLGNYS